MKTYNRGGDNILTRGAALKLLSQGADPIEFLGEVAGGKYEGGHPNYHVRRAAWLALGSPIPEEVAEQVTLLKHVQPNLFTRAVQFKVKDAAKVAHRAGEIKSITEHNAKAVLLREAEPEKFATLAAWLPIYQRDLRKFGENPESSQAEYNARASTAREVDTWLRERCEQHVPEPIAPTASFEYAALLCDDNGTGAYLLSPAVVDALPTTL